MGKVILNTGALELSSVWKRESSILFYKLRVFFFFLLFGALRLTVPTVTFPEKRVVLWRIRYWYVYWRGTHTRKTRLHPKRHEVGGPVTRHEVLSGCNYRYPGSGLMTLPPIDVSDQGKAGGTATVETAPPFFFFFFYYSKKRKIITEITVITFACKRVILVPIKTYYIIICYQLS